MAFKYKRLWINKKLILEHRWIIEQNLGRPLTKYEIVHHKNGNPKDNRIYNLEVMSPSDHIKKHLHGDGYRKWVGQFISKAKKGKPVKQFTNEHRKEAAQVVKQLWKDGKIKRRNYMGKNNPNYRHGKSIGQWDLYYKNK